MPETLSLGVSRRKRQAGHLSPSSNVMRNGWGCILLVCFLQNRAQEQHILFLICSFCTKNMRNRTFEVACRPTDAHEQPEREEFDGAATMRCGDTRQHAVTKHQHYLQIRVADLFHRVTIPPQSYSFPSMAQAKTAFPNLGVQSQTWLPKVFCVGHETINCMMILQHLCLS